MKSPFAGLRLASRPIGLHAKNGNAAKPAGDVCVSARGQRGIIIRRSDNSSAQLTILTAAAVVAAEVPGLLVFLLLAADAQTHAGQRHAAGFGNPLAALLAGRRALALWKPALGTANAVRNGVVDLFLYGAFARPTGRHSRGSIFPSRSSQCREAQCLSGQHTANVHVSVGCKCVAPSNGVPMYA